MQKIAIVGQTTDGKVFSSSWSHRNLADKVEKFLKVKYPSLTVNQIVLGE